MATSPSYVEIVVVTRAPMDTGNMALGLNMFIESERPTELNGYRGKVQPLIKWLVDNVDRMTALAMTAALRSPVFQVGEILFLDSNGRSVVGIDKKPDKWDVDVQTVDSLEEAIELSRSLTHDIEGVPWDQESQS